MQTSCVHHPTDDFYIIIHKWQLDFCDGNQCAAALLSYFEHWHNYKLKERESNFYRNEVAAKHEIYPEYDTSLVQFHKIDDLESRIFTYKRDAIMKGIALLISKKAISKHKNPNPKYGFDNTNYYLFELENINNYLDTYYENKNSQKYKTDFRCWIKPTFDVVQNRLSMLDKTDFRCCTKSTNNNIDNTNKLDNTDNTVLENNVKVDNNTSSIELFNTLPKKEKKIKKEKKVAAKKEKKASEDILGFAEMMKVYSEWYEKENLAPPAINQIDGKGLKVIISHLSRVNLARMEQNGENIHPDRDSPEFGTLNEKLKEKNIAAFKALLEMGLNAKDGYCTPFLKSQVNLRQISANINNIIKQISDGRNGTTTAGAANKGANSGTTPNGIDKEINNRYSS